MKPPNGKYRFHVTTDKNGSPVGPWDVEYEVDDAGVHTTDSTLEWDAEHDWFTSGDVTLRFVTGSTFAGANGSSGYGGTYAPA